VGQTIKKNILNRGWGGRKELPNSKRKRNKNKVGPEKKKRGRVKAKDFAYQAYELGGVRNIEKGWEVEWV